VASLLVLAGAVAAVVLVPSRDGLVPFWGCPRQPCYRVVRHYFILLRMFILLAGLVVARTLWVRSSSARDFSTTKGRGD
jgi:hypothetical protein